VADSIPDAKAARVPVSKSTTDMEPLQLQTSPPRNRAMSRSATMIMSPAEQAHLVSHMSAQEPRMFPGVIHERTRRGSVRASTANPDMGTLGPALAKMAVKEEAATALVEDESE
jgi:hypothetical protein